MQCGERGVMGRQGKYTWTITITLLASIDSDDFKAVVQLSETVLWRRTTAAGTSD